jgi:hypothetical protein
MAAVAESAYTAVPILPFPSSAMPMYVHVRQHTPAAGETEEDAEQRPANRTLFVAGVAVGYAPPPCTRPSHTARHCCRTPQWVIPCRLCREPHVPHASSPAFLYRRALLECG